jgi:multiple sugar transport system substrate-binding protein
VTRRALLALAGGGLLPITGAAACGGEAAPSGGPSRQPVEVAIFHRQAYTLELDQQVFPPAYDLFHQKTGIRVNETILPEAEIPDKVTTMAAARTPPEGSYIHPQWLGSMAANGLVVPIEPYVARDRSLNLADIYPGLLDYFRSPTIGGKLYGLPFYSGPSITVFNRALYDRYGVKAPDQWEKEGKWTWDTVRDVCVQLTKGSGAEKAWGWDGITTALHWLNIIIWGYGGDLWDRELGRTLLGEPPALEALQSYADLRARYNVVAEGPEAQGLPSSRAGKLPSGRVATRYGIKADIPTLAVGSGQGIQPGIAPIPKGRAGRFVRNGPNSFMIVKGSKEPEAVYRLIAWMTTMEFQAFQFKISATVAVRKSQMDSTEFQRSLQPWEPVAVWKEAAERDKALPMSARHSEIQELFGPAYTQVKEGKATAREVMQTLVPQINDLLRQARALQR